MNNRQKLIVVMLAVFLLWNIAAPLAGPGKQPAASQGVLDLTGWSFADGSVRLDGQWEWVPNEFAAPGQPGGGSAVRYIDVPGKWDKSFPEKRSTAIGAGTYRLQVWLPEHSPSYLAVRVTNIRNSHDLYMNGNKVGSSGTPALVPDRYEAKNHAYIAGTEVKGSKLEIVVHAANYSYYAGGGFFQSIWLGDMQSISRMKSFSVGADMTASIVFFTIGFIAALAYLLFHRRRELLIFALLNVSVMQYLLTHGEKLLYVVWPEVDYEWLTKLQMFATLQTICCIVALASILAQNRREKLAGKYLQVMYAGFGAVVLLTPAAFFTRIGYLTVTGTSVGYFFIFFILFRAVWSKHRHAFFIMIATLGVLAAALNQLLMEADVRKPSFDPSFEYIVFMVGLVLLLFDTYMRALADARKLSRSLIRSDQQKSDFLTGTSYELRTPIHTMMNLCHTLLLDGDKEFTPRQRRDVETIAAIGRRMSRLLDDMLELAEANEGKLLFAAERISVKPLVSAAVEMMSPLMNGKPIRILNLVPDGAAVTADEGRLVQMLTHLISNAILRLAEGTVTVHAETRANEVAITVREAGIFAQTDHLAPFQETAAGPNRAETQAARVTKQLAEQQGGTIEEHADAGGERVCTLTLPAAPDVASAAGREAASSTQTSGTGRQNRGKILVVSDESPNLQMMVKLLQAEQYYVTVMSHPDDVFELAQGYFSYDLVLLDVSLPAMSGYKLCRHIRLRYSGTELPILLLTASGRAEDVAAVFEAGANDYVVKPIDPAECSARIRGAMHLRKSIEERIRLELALVQAQIKPHFLYNTLNTIAALSEVDQDRTRELLMHFGEYLRASFDNRNLEPLVPFEKELELVRNYLHIEQTRFGDRLKVEYDGVDGVRFLIPPLTLQPLVENGIRHGLMKKSGGGTLRIAIDSSGPDHIGVSVIDDGAGIDPARIGPLLEGAGAGGIGLYNTHRRLLHTFGQGLDIHGLPSGGTKVSLRIPIKAAEEQPNRSIG